MIDDAHVLHCAGPCGYTAHVVTFFVSTVLQDEAGAVDSTDPTHPAHIWYHHRVPMGSSSAPTSSRGGADLCSLASLRWSWALPTHT
jgi:hypothetical protein